MVKRRGLSDLLRSESQRLDQSPEIQSQEETESVPSQTADLQTLPIVVDELLTEQQSLGEPDSVVPALPKYQRMVRKEARLHEAQYDELTRLARELNRKKQDVGEIITANTLLRVATELLLQRKSELRGDTEDQLLAHLTKEVNV